MSVFTLSLLLPLHYLALFFFLGAPLAPPSGKCVLLWPVFLLLLYWACCVWPSPGLGGLLGCNAARSFSGGPQKLEIPLETLVQPQQAGKVSGYRPSSVLDDIKWFSISTSAWLKTTYNKVKVSFHRSSLFYSFILNDFINFVVLLTSVLCVSDGRQTLITVRR